MKTSTIVLYTVLVGMTAFPGCSPPRPVARDGATETTSTAAITECSEAMRQSSYEPSMPPPLAPPLGAVGATSGIVIGTVGPGASITRCR